MSFRSKEKRAASNRIWYSANRERQRAWSRAYHKKIRAELDATKARPCMDCGVQYPPYVMDYDHRDPAAKTADVSAILGPRSLVEALKCDLVCANCHRERTYQRRWRR